MQPRPNTSITTPKEKRGHLPSWLLAGLCVITLILTIALPYQIRAAGEPVVPMLIGDTLAPPLDKAVASHGSGQFATTPAVAPTSIPSATAVYWGAYINGVPWDMTKLDAFESMLGKRASIVHFGQPWQQGGQFLGFPTMVMDRVRARGSIPMINWGSWRFGYGADQPDYRLSVIAKGGYDNYIIAWARAAKAWGQPFFLKFDHEMNGWWQFPWAEQRNGNQPGDYIKAWRHVHALFTQAGATNVTWVWCPNIVGPSTTPLASLYPGNAYVDWTCLHGYNVGGANWRTFTEIFRGYAGTPYDSYQQLLDLAPAKPIMLGEWASAEARDGGAQKAAWIRDALEQQIPNNFPRIRAVVWYNRNNTPDRTWVVESSSPSIQAFAEAIASPYYTHNQFATLGISPIPPPER